MTLTCWFRKHSARRSKDFEDLIHLIKINRINLNEPKVRATILKHGTKELFANYGEPARRIEAEMHDASDLEFPDWSGMKEHPVGMTFSEAVAWNEDMLKMFPPNPRTSEQRCDVEFKLLLWRIMEHL